VEQHLLYHKSVDRVRLEISGLYGQYLGSIYYESPDRRFLDGGLDLVLEISSAMIEELHRTERLGRLFLGPFGPVVPHGSAAMAEAQAMFQDFQARLRGRTKLDIGEVHPLPGVWLDPNEGMTLLRELGPRCKALSAEESTLRLVLLDREDPKATGWDLMHQNGTTHIGGWDQNVQERPGTLSEREAPRLQPVLEAARAVLERRLRGSA
jgi:hypothetical protein